MGPTPCRLFGQAQKVFEARVLRGAEMPFAEPSLLEVERTHKGEPAPRVEVRSGMCDPMLVEGHRYLVYAVDRDGELRLWTAIPRTDPGRFERHRSFLAARDDGGSVMLDGLVSSFPTSPVAGVRIGVSLDGQDVIARTRPGGGTTLTRVELESDRQGHFYAYGLPPGELALKLDDPRDRRSFPEIRAEGKAGKCLEVDARALRSAPF
ncbi:MAG: hypothetical protein AAGN66_01275 [Acidobacteriota bacterium]